MDTIKVVGMRKGGALNTDATKALAQKAKDRVVGAGTRQPTGRQTDAKIG